jgi:hypothetical protein
MILPQNSRTAVERTMFRRKKFDHWPKDVQEEYCRLRNALAEVRKELRLISNGYRLKNAASALPANVRRATYIMRHVDPPPSHSSSCLEVVSKVSQ